MLSLFLRKTKQRTWNIKKHIEAGFPGHYRRFEIEISRRLSGKQWASGVKSAQNDPMVQEPGHEMIVLIALDCNHTQRWRWDSLLNSKCL